MQEEIKNKLDELQNFDFSSGENLNIDEYYNLTSEIKNPQKEELQQLEADNFIQTIGSKTINPEYFNKLTFQKENILNFIRKYDPNVETVKALTDEEKDKLFGISTYIMSSYGANIVNMIYTLELPYDEVEFIEKVISHKIEYNSEQVFTYTEFRQKFWDGAMEIFQRTNKKDTLSLDFNTSYILMLQDLISKYTTKGANKDYHLFKNVLYKLAQISQLYNSFKIVYERLSNDMNQWRTNLSNTDKI